MNDYDTIKETINQIKTEKIEGRNTAAKIGGALEGVFLTTINVADSKDTTEYQDWF